MVVPVTTCEDIYVITHLNVKCVDHFRSQHVRLCGSLAWKIPRPLIISQHDLLEKESIRSQLFSQKRILEKSVGEQKKTEDRLQNNYVEATLRVSKLKKKILEGKRQGGVTLVNPTLKGGDHKTDNGRTNTRDGDLLPETDLEVQLHHTRAERAEIWRYYHNEKNSRQKDENHLHLLTAIYNCITNSGENSTASDGSDSMSTLEPDTATEPNNTAVSIICPICSLTLKFR